MREWSTVPLQWGHLFRWWVGPQHPGKQGDFSCLQSTLQWVQRGSRNSAPVRVVSSSGAVPSLSWRKHPGPLEAMGQTECRGRTLPPRARLLLYLGQGGVRVMMASPVRKAIQLCSIREDELEVCVIFMETAKAGSWATECKEGTTKVYTWMNVGGHSQERDGWELVFSGNKKKASQPSHLNLQNWYIALTAKEREQTPLK